MAVVVNDIGAIGAVVSTIREKAVEACEVLPAASVAFAVIECVPSLSAVEGVKEKSPSLSAVVVPKELMPLKISTVLLAYALPIISGFLSAPTEVELNEVGTYGVRVSTDKVKVLLLSDPSAFSFPAESENFDEATILHQLYCLQSG